MISIQRPAQGWGQQYYCAKPKECGQPSNNTVGTTVISQQQVNILPTQILYTLALTYLLKTVLLLAVLLIEVIIYTRLRRPDLTMLA